MKGLVAIALFMLVAPASAELVWSAQGDSMIVAGLGAVENGALLTHQNLALDVSGPGIGFSSQTMHDHDAFFWFASEPADVGQFALAASGPAGEAQATVPTAPAASASVSSRDDGATVFVEGAVTSYWWVTDADDALMAAGAVAPGAEMPVFRWGDADGWTFHQLGGGTFGESSYQAASEGDPLSTINDLLDGEREPAAPCTGLLQEPAGDWYEDTHVRLGWQVPDALAGGEPTEVHYTILGTDGFVGQVAVRDPFGHAVMRIPAAGAYTLSVEADGATCDLPINVMASEGSAAPIWGVTAREGGFDVAFTADTTAHYDVEAIVRDEQTHRLVYAGKLHSHGGGIKGSFDVPPGDYSVNLFAVAQGAGPTIEAPMVASVSVSEAPVASEKATPAVGLLPMMIGLVALGLRRR